MTVCFDAVDTPDGPFSFLAAEDGTVVAAGWTADVDDLLARVAPAHRPTAVRAGAAPEVAAAVRAFYDGDFEPAMQVAVRQHGTALQQRGWEALRQVAPGTPLTYASFAIALGSPAAVRPAAAICARNAVGLFVPCHRVLRSDGTLGGFAWGVPIKRSLLDREAARGVDL